MWLSVAICELFSAFLPTVHETVSSSATVLSHLMTLLISTLIHLDDEPNIWSTSVRDVPWFSRRHVAASTIYRNAQPAKQQTYPSRPPGSVAQNSNSPFPSSSSKIGSRAWRSRYTRNSFNQLAPNGGQYEFAHNARRKRPSSDEGPSEEPPPPNIPTSIERLTSHPTGSAHSGARNETPQPLRPVQPVMSRQHQPALPFRAVETSNHPLTSPSTNFLAGSSDAQVTNTSTMVVRGTTVPAQKHRRQYSSSRAVSDPRALPLTPDDINAFYPSHVKVTTRSAPPVPAVSPYASSRNGERDWDNLSPAQRIAMETRSRNG